MVDQIAIVEHITDGTVGTVDITSPNITEPFRAAFFMYAVAPTDDTDTDHGIIGCGACQYDGGGGSDSANENAGYCTHGRNDALNAPDYNSARDAGDSSSSCIVIVSGVAPATPVVRASFDSVISGGVRLNFDTNTAGFKIYVVLFAGLSNAWVGTMSTATSASATTGAGSQPAFEPDLLITFGGSGTLNSLQADAQGAMGFVTNTDPIQQCSAFVNFDDATEPSDADGEVSTTKAVCGHQAATRASRHLEVTAFNSDGFDYTASDGVLLNAMYLALKFSGQFRISAKTEAIAASTGNQTFNSFGFTPDLVIGHTTLLASADTYTDGATAAAFGMFLTGRYRSRAATMHGEEGLSGTGISFNTENRTEEVALLCYEHQGAIANRATWVGGSGSGGFVLNFSVATAGHFVALGIQLIPNPPLPLRRRKVARRARLSRMRYRSVGGILGVQAAQAGNFVLRLIQRARRKMLERLRPRRAFPTITINTTPSATDQDPEGSVFAAGAERGSVFCGGAEEASVL